MWPWELNSTAAPEETLYALSPHLPLPGWFSKRTLEMLGPMAVGPGSMIPSWAEED